MIYPFTHGHALRIVTIASIYSGMTAMLLHAFYSFGWRYTITYLGATLIFAFLIEEIGVKTSWPFGEHTFDSSLGAKIYDVPLVILSVWLMLAHPILVAARRVTRHWVFLYGGAILMAWHLFIDPQLAIAHRVKWIFTGAHVPFENELPLSNLAGWLFTGMLLVAILHYVLPRDRRKKGAEFAAVDVFLGWILVAGVFENVFFAHRPGIAIFAGTIYAVALAPYFFSRWLGRPVQ